MSSSALERLADRITEHLVAMELKPSDHPGGPHIFRYGSSMVFVSPFERGEECFVRFSALVLKDFRPNLALLTRVLRLNNELPYGAFLLFEGDTLAFAVTLPGRDLAEATFKKTLHYTAWIADEYDDEFQALGGGLRAEELLAGPEGLNPDSSSSPGSRGSGLAE